MLQDISRKINIHNKKSLVFNKFPGGNTPRLAGARCRYANTAPTFLRSWERLDLSNGFALLPIGPEILAGSDVAVLGKQD